MNEKLNSQERIIAEIKILSGNQFFGLTNKELSKLLGTSEVNVCRDLAVFGDWIERSAKDGRVRLSPGFGKLANNMMKGFKDAKLRLTEEEARYASEMQ